MLKERFLELEKQFLKETMDFYGERLVSVVVFGSVARGTQRFDSDFDVLIVAEGLPSGRIKRINEFSVVEEKLEPLIKNLREEGINTFLSVIIRSIEEIQKGTPLLLDMVEDSKILFDRDNFFKGIIEGLRKKLDELGARRIWSGNAWYWDLKPDFTPGDIIEL